MKARIWRLTLVWHPQRWVVFGKKTWTHTKTYYTTDRDEVLRLRKEHTFQYGPRVFLRAVSWTYNEPLNTWLKTRSRSGRTEKGWR